MSTILVFAQVSDQTINELSLQCLAKARELAGGGKVAAILIGSNVAALAQQAPADTVHVADDSSLAQYLPCPFKAVLKQVLASEAFDVVLLPATTSGNDLAALAAAELGAPCVLDATGLLRSGSGLVAERLEFDRKVDTAYAAAGKGPLFVTLKDGIAEPAAGTPGMVCTVEVQGAASRAKVLKRDVARKSVNLKGARIIVGAGAGVGSPENFEKIRQLANVLGAEIGATRAVVDAGWLSADHQIGQTGATVRPDVYIACGISGAVQHWVGMSEARKIIAINTDKNAPIMRRAHYRIAGDLNAVIPKLIKLLA